MTNDSLSIKASSWPILYLARHGQTEYNLNRIFQGRLDIPLNQTGLDQARTMQKLLEQVPLTRAYISPLDRARVTASIILEGRDIPLSVEPDLVEIDFGAWDGVPEAEVKEKWMDDYLNYRTDFMEFHPENGESTIDAQARAGKWWDRTKAEFSFPNEHILVVAHQSLNAALACYVAEIGLDRAWEHFKSRPGEVIRIVPGPIAMVTRLSQPD